MRPLATITTTDPTELQDLLRCICDLYIGTDGRQVDIEYGITGLRVSVEEPVEYVDIAERISFFEAGTVPVLVDVARPVEPTTVTTYDDEPEAPASSANVAQPPEPAVPFVRPKPKDPFATKNPTSNPDGSSECLACDDRFNTPRAVSDHVKASHWDLVIASYADNGVPGIITDWGVAASTAYRWASMITGDTAA